MKLRITLLSLLCTFTMYAQKPIEIAVWPNGATESNEITDLETITDGKAYNSKEARIYVYLPEESKNTGACILICPGGGYGLLAMDHEGHEFARWLASQGIAGAVLKYRLPNGHYNIPLSDAKEAMCIIRREAAKWNISPDKIGVSGFSAGGHLASTLGTHYDKESKPNFMILFYPVITLREGTHKGTKENLLGNLKNDEHLTQMFSNEMQVDAETPPTLLFLSDNDLTVPPGNSTSFYEALKSKQVPASIYVFPTGGHGWGLRSNFRYHETWKNLLLDWLNYEAITSPAQ